MVSSLAVRLRILREERNFTQEQMGKELGVSENTVFRWEHGENPRIERVKEIAEYFGVTEEYLMGFSELRNKADVVMTEDDRREVIVKFDSLSKELQLLCRQMILNAYEIDKARRRLRREV